MLINNIELRYFSTMPHLSMIITGFRLLAQQGVIKKLSIIDATNEVPSLSNTMIVEATIDSRLKIAYDVCDGYVNFQTVNDAYASSVDFYFMRSFSAELNKKLFPNANILPLGMNYCCIVKGYNFNTSLDIKSSTKNAVKKFLSKFNPQISIPFDYRKYEFPPTYRTDRSPKIMFNTRLWNPKGDIGEKKWDREHPERVHINNTRIRVIQQARSLYGADFSGGLYSTQYAKETAPTDLLLPNSKTTKRGYLRAMQSCDICIGSEGLHGSIGWKTAEYVASSKAIIMERPKYTLPGDFKEGQNYLGFSDEKECMKQLEYLFNNRDKIVELQKNNQKYYNKWLRPDMQILQTLKLALRTK